MEERAFFSSENVYVSLTRFVAFGQTYAMSGVTSVGAREVAPDYFNTIVAMVLGVICVLIGFAFPVLMIVGFAVIAFAFYFMSSKSPDYYVMLTTAAGQVQAVRSKDKEYISSIVQALNDCIVARG